MVSTTSTQTIDLEPMNHYPEDAPPDASSTHPITSRSAAFDPAVDAIIAESLLADSQVPDGGYGWVVIFACSILTFWFVGTSYSWGIIQAALLKEKLGSPGTLSFVGSLTTACISFFALVNARLIRAIGGRSTGLLGVALGGGGTVLSGFATKNIGALFFTSGLLVGVGTRYIFPHRKKKEALLIQYVVYSSW